MASGFKPGIDSMRLLVKKVTRTVGEGGFDSASGLEACYASQR